MSSAVAEINRPANRSVTLRADRPLVAAEVLQIEAEQRRLLGEYVKQQMVPGEDYGVIPGTNDRKSLLKPGAEKLTSLFRCTPRFEIVKQIEDWDKPFFYYQFHVIIESNDTGAAVAEGFGSANSHEGKWRWRNAARVCPSCGVAAIIKGKAEFGGGWVCFKKKDGCGDKFDDGDPRIESQQVGRIENPDICDQVNTILKIAKKRALVDAAIALARCSDMFTQDVEDDEVLGAAKANTSTADPGALTVSRDRGRLEGLLAALSIIEGKSTAETVSEFCAAAKIATLNDLPGSYVEGACRRVQGRIARIKSPAGGEAKPGANGTPTPASQPQQQAAPPVEREPGDDDLSDDGDDMPAEWQETKKATLPEAVAEALRSDLSAAGVDIDKLRAKSFGIIGRTMGRDESLESLSLDEAGKVRTWAQSEKKGRKGQPASSAA